MLSLCSATLILTLLAQTGLAAPACSSTKTQTTTTTKTVTHTATATKTVTVASAKATSTASCGSPTSVVGSWPRVDCAIDGISENQRFAQLALNDGGRYFGNAVTSWYYQQDQEYLDILECHFSSYTPENEMKWEVIQPSPGVFNWTGADLIMYEAKRTGSIVRGHNFVWISQTPDYVTNITDPTELKAVLKTHIDAVMGRYGNDLAYFDVINEPLNANGTYMPSVWYNVLGEDFIRIALEYAHAAAPNVKLCINDYGIEDVNIKSQKMAEIAKGLLADGVPLHCIGFESHFIGGLFPGDIAQSMNQFTDMGLEVPLTELDIRLYVDESGFANATQIAQQAIDYSHGIGACLNNNLCPGVTLWEFADQYSWVPASFPGQGAADVYNTAYEEKPAYTAVASALAADFTET